MWPRGAVPSLVRSEVSYQRGIVMMLKAGRRRVVNAVQSCSFGRSLSSLQERLAAGPDLDFFTRSGSTPLGLPASAPGRTVWLETYVCIFRWLLSQTPTTQNVLLRIFLSQIYGVVPVASRKFAKCHRLVIGTNLVYVYQRQSCCLQTSSAVT